MELQYIATILIGAIICYIVWRDSNNDDNNNYNIQS